jgi:dihydroorotase
MFLTTRNNSQREKKMTSVSKITLARPDDFHLHVRQGGILSAVAPFTGQQFGRALIMPNIVPAVRTADHADNYRTFVHAAMPGVELLMTLYLTSDTTPAIVQEAHQRRSAFAVKYYPRGATTNSSEGLLRLEDAYSVFEAMEKFGMPLCMHGETVVDDNGNETDPYDREAIFINRDLEAIRKRFPSLKIVFEHLSSRDGAEYIEAYGSPTLGATVTPHHLVLDRRDFFRVGVNPHFHCLPVIKRREDAEALRKLITSGNEFVFLGTDSAPHDIKKKAAEFCCSGGCFVAPVALPLYAQVFEEENALDKFEAFASRNGARFYGLKPNGGKPITLVRETWQLTEKDTVSVYPRNEPAVSIRPFGFHPEEKKNYTFTWKCEAI